MIPLSDAREPNRHHTHAITIPGTTYLAFAAGKLPALALAKDLAKTRTRPTLGRKRGPKAEPVVQTVEEWSNP